jgi:hypothetical protein
MPSMRTYARPFAASRLSGVRIFSSNNAAKARLPIGAITTVSPAIALALQKTAT